MLFNGNPSHLEKCNFADAHKAITTEPSCQQRNQ